MTKTIIIDEYKCDGCGLCVKACHEGALALINGKAKIVRADYCDGMGDCLPACPRGAISFVDTLPHQGIDVLKLPETFQSNPEMMPVPGVQWPIQLALVSPRSDFLKGTLVIGADCTAFKVAGFCDRVVRKDPRVIGCPKLDEKSRCDKRVEIFRENPIERVKVVRMEVPCCGHLTELVRSAIKTSGKDIALEETVVRRDGTVI